jgi:hypothetical protein
MQVHLLAPDNGVMDAVRTGKLGWSGHDQRTGHEALRELDGFSA